VLGSAQVPSGYLRVGLAAVTALCLGGCASAPVIPDWATEAPGEDPIAGLYLSPQTPAIASNEKLRLRLASEPHAYFRYINVAFSRAVCYEFAASLGDLPSVNLHGDAHLEQYAVTDAGRGLTDFDDSSSGPPLIDLVRFGVSLRLASQARGWYAGQEVALTTFLDAYVAALHDDTLTAPEPAFVAGVEAEFSDDRRDFLQWSDSVSPEVELEQQRAVDAAFTSYVARRSEQTPDVDPGFFRVKRLGRPALGVGSASDEKYVLRVEGPTAADDDDLVLEAKELRDLVAIPCVRAGAKANPFRVLVGRVHTPYLPYLGYFGFHGKTFWVHAWQANYRELDIHDERLTTDDLQAVAYETGVQLARAHLQRWDGSADRQLGHRVEHAVEGRLDAVREAVVVLTEGTLAAWERFRATGAAAGEG
jgi:uncharacterized protein (DUF2252 family)